MVEHAHGHHHVGAAVDRRVLWALAINAGLTLVQIAGGLLAGSLALIADALHNLSDAISLGIAFGARRISRRPADNVMTFGYARAEIIAALVNYTTLIIMGLYLCYEGLMRFLEPQAVDGWPVVIIAGVALGVDTATAFLTWTLSRTSVNIRAAFLHNIADALASIGVIVSGTLIILYGWDIVDPIVTLLIAAYLLWQALSQVGGVMRILMLGAPARLDLEEVLETLGGVDGVESIHHLHVWALDEAQTSLEAHVVVADSRIEEHEAIRERIRALARQRFAITHATLEIERASARCKGADAQAVGHPVNET